MGSLISENTVSLLTTCISHKCQNPDSLTRTHSIWAGPFSLERDSGLKREFSDLDEHETEFRALLPWDEFLSSNLHSRRIASCCERAHQPGGRCMV